jgi:hypothetical protein
MLDIEYFRRFVPVVTFMAGSVTVAVGAHKLVDAYSEPDPAFRLISARVVMSLNKGTSTVRIQVEKLRAECKRSAVNLEFKMKDETSASSPVDMGGQLTKGYHVVIGRFDGPPMFDVDLKVPPVLQTFHSCEEDKPAVVATCTGYYAGADETLCAEE